MKVLVLPILLIASCTSLPAGDHTCELAPLNEGWLHIETPPAGIRAIVPSSQYRKVIWFQNKDGRILACQRGIDEPGCGENANIFEQTQIGWEESKTQRVIVCGSN